MSRASALVCAGLTLIGAASAGAAPRTTASEWEARKLMRAREVESCVSGASAKMAAMVDMPAVCECALDGIMARYPTATLRSTPHPAFTSYDKDIARACWVRYAPRGMKLPQ